MMEFSKVGPSAPASSEGKKKKKKRGVKIVKAVLEDEDDYEEIGNSKSIDALFKKAGSFFRSDANLQETDLKKIEEEHKRLQEKSRRGKDKKRLEEKQDAYLSEATTSTADSENSEKVARKRPSDEYDAYSSVALLVQEIDEYLGNDKDKMASDHSNGETREVDVIDLHDSDETNDDLEIDCPPNKKKGCTNNSSGEQMHTTDEDSICEQGKLLSVKVSWEDKNYHIFIYEKQSVRELREMFAKKAGIAECESIQLFNETVILEDAKSVKDYGISLGSCIDAFMLHKTEKELFDEGSTSIFHFKLQTDDRRGRENLDMYIRKTATIRNLREKYSQVRKIDPNDVKLMFDGEILDLDQTPAECDLEGGECIDVIIA